MYSIEWIVLVTFRNFCYHFNRKLTHSESGDLRQDASGPDWSGSAIRIRTLHSDDLENLLGLGCPKTHLCSEIFMKIRAFFLRTVSQIVKKRFIVQCWRILQKFMGPDADTDVSRCRCGRLPKFNPFCSCLRTHLWWHFHGPIWSFDMKFLTKTQTEKETKDGKTTPPGRR